MSRSRGGHLSASIRRHLSQDELAANSSQASDPAASQPSRRGQSSSRLRGNRARGGSGTATTPSTTYQAAVGNEEVENVEA